MKDILSKKIAVLAGGTSSEREISLESGKAVYKALKEEGCSVIFIDVDKDTDKLKTALLKNKIDVAFIALHGRFGEDGTIQELLEGLGMPYTGSGPKASRCALDKLASKEVFASSRIDTPPFKTFKRTEKINLNGLDVPVVVKPINEGSSIGLSIVKTKKNLKVAIDKAYNYDDTVLIEKYIKGREITVGILNEKPLQPIEIVPGAEFYNYEAKYSSADTKYIVPALITDEANKRAKMLATQAHTSLGCKGFSRVDMILDQKDKPYVLEVNTIPGLTSRSLLPKAALEAGISFGSLCKKIVELALK